ncbi:MAG: GGDEF domain-containing protein [Eubacterium sp.]|nr:GGDEF domain-containing protein [Eubacterium sp.]
MYSNGRKTIGVLLYNLNGEFQVQICKALEKRTKEMGYNLAVFNMFGEYGQSPNHMTGELSIFDLPPYDELDGIIVALETFTSQMGKSYILKKIREEAKCPVVSLREYVPDFSNVLVDDEHAMDDIVDHLVNHHHIEDIAFMTGPENREDAQLRAQSFRNAMEENGITVSDDRIFYGDFWRWKAHDACDYFFANGKIPGAIACANDVMAIAVIEELYRRGYEVPGDVIVTGYDGDPAGQAFLPALTTVYVDFDDMANKAVNLLLEHEKDDEVETLYASTKLLVKESCGCEDCINRESMRRRILGHKTELYKENLEMQISFLTIALNQAKDIRDLHKVVKIYIYNFDNFTNYYICLREDFDQDVKTMHGYTDKMRLWVDMTDRTDRGRVDVKFDKSSLLPPDVVKEDPVCFYFSPIHHEDWCFGYAAMSFDHSKDDPGANIRWNIAIANFIQSQRIQKKMNNLIDELENMYVQDVLTGLYNRRGFEKYARMQFSQARAAETMICVMAIDMDGLKPINDIYGHHEGDSALKSVGYAIREAAHHGQIGARIGGDEFEVIFPCQGEEEVIEWINNFNASIENYNKKSNKPYFVYASCGYKIGIPTSNDTIESYMNESDDIMYKNKIANKIRRSQELR